MGNLQQPKQKFIINSVDANTLKLFGTGNTKLQLNGYGVVLDSEKLQSIVHGCYTAGVVQAEVLDILGPCPCSSCNYEAGLTVHRIPKLDGYTNQYWPTSRYYAHAIDGLGTCSSGLLSATDLAAVKAGIIESIRLDENFPHNQLPAAIVKSGQAVHMTLWNNATAATISITGPTGTVYTSGVGAVAAAATRAAFITNLNAITDAGGTGGTQRLCYAYADPSSAVGIYLIPYVNGAKFTTTTCAVTAGTGVFTANDGVNDAAITGTGTGTSDTKRFVGLVGVNSDVKFRVTFPSGFATQTILEAGSYSILSSAEVARQFPIQSWHMGQQPNIAIKDGEYCRYTFRQEHDTYDVTAASHKEHYDEWIELYVLKSVAETANFNGKFNDWLYASGVHVASPSWTV